LAGDLGAEFAWLKAEDAVTAIVEFAHQNKISRVLLGRPQRNVLGGLFQRSVPERLLYETRDLDVEIARDES
jgi:K+-sensing histidine kinase KdpD